MNLSTGAIAQSSQLNLSDATRDQVHFTCMLRMQQVQAHVLPQAVLRQYMTEEWMCAAARSLGGASAGHNPLFGAGGNSPGANSPEAALFYNGLFRVSFGRHSSRSFSGTGQHITTELCCFMQLLHTLGKNSCCMMHCDKAFNLWQNAQCCIRGYRIQ